MTYVDPITLSVNFPSHSHIFDSGAKAAWQEGWNGSGSTISVIDDFDFKQTSLNVPISYTAIFRISSVGALFQAQYKKNMSLVFPMSHGDLVSGLAGGKPSNWQHTEVQMQDYVLTACSSIQNLSCPPSYPASDRFAQGLVQAQGVAKNALVTNNHVGLGDNLDPVRFFTLLQGHLSNSARSTVVNLSFGRQVQIGNLSIENLINETKNTRVASTVSAVITVAAGNDKAPCVIDNFATCNAIAAALVHQQETKFNTIVVGALAGSGVSENIASYSNRAGALAQRYLMARGDAYGLPGGGTSFAAPRVAGAAAILKQRYPGLTGKQIADVLLLSANKDINNDGTPDFEGVSQIYGHGKLDLQRAMQLAEAL